MTPLDRIARHITEHQDEHIARIQALIKRPSLSTAGGVGIHETARYLRDEFEAIGCRQAEVIDTPGNPIVLGHYDAGAPRTLIIYFMYDTEAVLDEDRWLAPPFEGRLVTMPPFGRCLVGRGAINTKGPLGAFLNAMQAIRAAGERVPVNLTFIAEGEEELGSASLGAFVKQHAERLRADGLFFPMPRQDASGRVTVALGSRRGVIFELECNGELWGRGPAQFDIHSGNGSLVDNPAHRLIEAVASLATHNGNRVLVEGFYDDVVPPDDEQNRLLDSLAERWDEAEFKARLGVKGFIDGVSGRDAVRRLMFEPTLGIRGMYAGDARPGDVTVSMAIIPHRAVCKMNVSLVPNQNKEDLARKIRVHLDRRGYPDVKMTLRPGTIAEPSSWGRVRTGDGIVAALLGTYRRFGLDPEVWPLSPGGWPGHLFQKYLGTPFVAGGVGHGGRAHSTNEYLVIDGNAHVCGLAEMEKSFAAVLYEFAALA